MSDTQLAELITHARQIAENLDCDAHSCAYYHDRLVDYLEELQEFRRLKSTGRLHIVDYPIGASVQGKTGNWLGTVGEVCITDTGVMLYIQSGGNGFYASLGDVCSTGSVE